MDHEKSKNFEAESTLINPFATGNTPMCDWVVESVDNITAHV